MADIEGILTLSGWGCWQDLYPSLGRAAGGWGCLFSAPSRELGLGNMVWECSGLRHRKMKSQGLEQSWHESRTETPSYKNTGSGLVFCILQLCSLSWSSAWHLSCSMRWFPSNAFGRLSASLSATETSSARSRGAGCPAVIAGYLKPTSINFCLEQGLMNRQPAAIRAPGLPREGAVGCVWRQKLRPFPNPGGEICFAKCPFWVLT